MTAAANIDYKEQYEQALLSIEELKHQLSVLKKLIFESRSERFVPADTRQSSQLPLGLAPDAPVAEACKLSDYEKITIVRTRPQSKGDEPGKHHGRMKLPEFLRRINIEVVPDVDVTGLRKIGEEITEVVEYIPGEWVVNRYIRSKYIQPGATNDKFIIASLPGRMLEKCRAGEGLLATITVDKYVDHIPMQRQLARIERESGLRIPQSTMTGWMAAVLKSLLALYGLHKRLTLNSRYLNVDETGCPVQDSDKKGACHRGYYWVYYNSVDKIVLFDYRKGRGREGPDDILQNFQGYLQTDGYGAYEDFGKRPGIILMNCFAHARRKFDESLQTDKPRAEHALKEIQLLYAVERQIAEQHLQGEAVLEIRQREAVPVLTRLKAWMVEQLPQVRPKSPIGVALAYSLKRWDKLCVYTTEAILGIDNNLVENAIRPAVLGRKNYLFAGSHEAAQRAAMIYSLFATCRMHQINPHDWLKDVLQRMHLYTTSNLEELLPQNWKAPEK